MFEVRKRRRSIDWKPIVAHLQQAVVGEDANAVDGTLNGVPVYLRFDPTDGTTLVEATRALDDRFSLRITPRAQVGDFDAAFVVHATPLDLPRVVLDDDLRARLLAIEPRPTVQLERSRLTLEVTTMLDAESAIAALEVVARLVRSLDDRATMCPR